MTTSHRDAFFLRNLVSFISLGDVFCWRDAIRLACSDVSKAQNNQKGNLRKVSFQCIRESRRKKAIEHKFDFRVAPTYNPWKRNYLHCCCWQTNSQWLKKEVHLYTAQIRFSFACSLHTNMSSRLMFLLIALVLITIVSSRKGKPHKFSLLTFVSFVS